MGIKSPTEAKERIILALDVDTIEQAENLVVLLKDYVGYFKIGLQLMSSCGFEAFEIVRKHGGKIFCDSKFHDIPNTVAKASANLMTHGVDFFSIHISGGSKMLYATTKASKETAKHLGVEPATILGVTLLSSFGQRTLTEELNVKINIDDYVMHLAKTAKEAGLDGVLASASEVKRIRQVCGNDFIIVCPAIRPTWSVVNDQIRVVTPTDAILSGVDYMIIGRPITNAENPVAAAELIIDEISQALIEKAALAS